MLKRLTHIFVTMMLVLVWSYASEAQQWGWLTTAGGLRSDKATTIVVDDNGYSYVTGYYNEQAQFGPFDTGFSFPHSKEVFVAKVDPQGNYVWVKNGTNYYDDRGLGLCLDPNGNVYVTGTCWGGLNFGSLSVYNSTSYTDQIYVIKLDNDGNEIWMKNAGVDPGGYPYNDDHGQDLASDSQGNIYVTGFISNNSDVPQNANFDSHSIPMQPHDSLAFLAKLSNSGSWQWVNTFPGIHSFRDNAVAVDNEDNVYVAGGFVGTKTFETQTITSVGGVEEDIYVIKYNSSGNFLYVVTAGDSLRDRADGITYGNDGHMYVTGEFRDHALFGTHELNNYGDSNKRDIFVAKLSTDGVWKWAKKAGSKKGKDRGIGIAANKQGNIFVAGQFSGAAKFGQFEVDSNGDSVQIFVASIDTTGEWRWVLAGGSPDFDRGVDVDCDESCNLYVTGYYAQTLTLGSNSVTAVDGKDIFIAQVTDACSGFPPPPPGEGPDEPELCDILPINVFSPNGDQINEELKFTEYCNTKGEYFIANRWGEVVFTAGNLNTGWDGKTNLGVPVQEGTYFYKLTIEHKNGEKEEIHGFITLVR